MYQTHVTPVEMLCLMFYFPQTPAPITCTILRTKHIETWDVRMLPSRPSSGGLAPLLQPPFYSPPAPPQLAKLDCACGSPDFWVEPHGLTVAVYGAPRNSQSYGAKHAFWSWPKNNTSRLATAHHVLENAGEAQFSSRGSPAGCTRRGFEIVVPGVVHDTEYRMCPSTGIKFVDTHMATVLDPPRVLVDEVVVACSGSGASKDRDDGDSNRSGARSIESVLLTA